MDPPKIPKQRRIKRDRDVTVPSTSTSELRRHTLLPSECTLQQNAQKKKGVSDRMSLFPTEALDTRMPDSDLSDTDLLHLQYNRYMRSIALEFIMKKKKEELRKSFICKLAEMAKEQEELEQKLFKLKSRERDIRNLSKIQNEIDSQITDINNSIKKDDIKMLENILSELHSRLKHLDVLRLDNVIVPETPEEYDQMIETLKSCLEITKSIMDLIGTNSECYRSVMENLNAFINNFNDIKEQQARAQKDLRNLQELVLETGALSLASAKKSLSYNS